MSDARNDATGKSNAGPAHNQDRLTALLHVLIAIFIVIGAVCLISGARSEKQSAAASSRSAGADAGTVRPDPR